MILIIESSANFPSVAICDAEGELLFFRVENIPQSHSEKLPVLVKNALIWLKDNNKELSAVAVNSGPGSYTGLRIGVSLAKGICYAKQIPLLAIDGLKAMALDVLKLNPQIDVVYSMLDARREEVFLKRINRIGVQSEIQAVILIEHLYAENWESVAFVGNSNEKAQRILNVKTALNVDGPYANQFVDVASELYQNQKFENVAYFEPFYLKDFVPGISKKFAV